MSRGTTSKFSCLNSRFAKYTTIGRRIKSPWWYLLRFVPSKPYAAVLLLFGLDSSLTMRCGFERHGNTAPTVIYHRRSFITAWEWSTKLRLDQLKPDSDSITCNGRSAFTRPEAPLPTLFSLSSSRVSCQRKTWGGNESAVNKRDTNLKDQATDINYHARTV